jgi:hypothetical protein
MQAIPWVHQRADAMTMTEPGLSRPPILRRCFPAVFRWWASSASTPRSVEQREASAPARGASHAPTTLAAVVSPAQRCAAEPDSHQESTTVDIPAEDWDLLFRAVLDVLERMAVARPAPNGAGAQLQAPGAVIQECLDALDQLRRAVPAVQPQLCDQSLCSGGASGPSSARPPGSDAGA